MGRNERLGSVRSGLAGGCEQVSIQVRGDADGGGPSRLLTWELTRAAASGHAAIQVVDRVAEVDRLVTVVQEMPVTTVPKGAEWPAALAQLATALDTGRIYDRDLPTLAQALVGVADALDRRPGWRLRKQ